MSLEIDEERIGKNDKVLAVIPNQYMLLQTLWYHSKYPEGIWDVIIVPYGKKESAKKTEEFLYHECEKSGIFSRIILFDKLRVGDNPLRQIIQYFGYVYQYMTHKRGQHDFNLIKNIMGHCNYRKVIIHPVNMTGTAAINAVREAGHDAVLVCMEDGMADYTPPVGRLQFRSVKELFYFTLSKMTVVNLNLSNHHFEMAYDRDVIKYNSLPDRMKYKNYKCIKQLFDDSPSDVKSVKGKNNATDDKYDLLLFTSPLAEDFACGKSGEIYSQLHDWLKTNCMGRRILLKPHPRERYTYPWNDLSAEVGEINFAGETVLDKYPNADCIFTFISTILLKVCREKRNYKVVYFRDIKDKEYHKLLALYSDILGMSEDNWIYI